MKNWKKTGIAALCVAALLAGCGTQGGDTNNNDKNADEPKEISLEQVRADNIPEKLLEDHDTVTVSIQGTDQDSKETYTAKVQYTRDDKETCCWPRTTATPPTAPWARMISLLRPACRSRETACISAKWKATAA